MTQSTVTTILNRVMAAVEHAENKHPIWPIDRLRQLVIIQEEMGELTHAVLECVELHEAGYRDRYHLLEHRIDAEAEQVGAMIFRFLEGRLPNV